MRKLLSKILCFFIDHRYCWNPMLSDNGNGDVVRWFTCSRCGKDKPLDV